MKAPETNFDPKKTHCHPVLDAGTFNNQSL